MLWAAVKMVFAMGVGLTLLYLLIRFTKRLDSARRGSSPDAGIKVLTSKPIAPQKYISLVDIGGEVFALGISEAQITLLTKIENKEFIERIKAHRSMTRDPSSFLHQLSKIPGGLKGGYLRISHGK